jgi:predicted dehydrogenase
MGRLSSPLPVRIVALADPHRVHLQRALEVVRQCGKEPPLAFPDCRAVLDRRDIDAVVVATPVHAHASQAIAALDAGKHVYCEKPLGTGVEESRRVLGAAREAARAGQVFQVGLQRRYHPRYQSSLRFIHGGEAGRVLFVRAQWHVTAGPGRRKPWLSERAKSGDIVVEQACHQFDVLNWLFRAPPVRACGFGGRSPDCDRPPTGDVRDHYGAVVEYPEGAKVHLSHLSFAVPDRRFSGIHELVFAERGGVDLANATVWTPSGEASRLPVVPGNETELALSGFLECLATGQQPVASVDVGYRATLAALLCRQALDTGETAHWKDLQAS